MSRKKPPPPPTPQPLTLTANPLLADRHARTADVQELTSPVVIRRPQRTHMRELRDLRRRQSAAEAIAGLDLHTQIFGFTKGQFSLLDLITAILGVTGPADVSLSTWTAARHEIDALSKLREAGAMRSMRWLVDFTFARRDAAATHAIRNIFGVESIRVAQNHAKFAVFRNDTWEAVLLTSMNLNMNPRFEDFNISHDPEMSAFLTRILDEIWARQTRTLADAEPRDIRRFFTQHM